MQQNVTPHAEPTVVLGSTLQVRFTSFAGMHSDAQQSSHLQDEKKHVTIPYVTREPGCLEDKRRYYHPLNFSQATERHAKTSIGMSPQPSRTRHRGASTSTKLHMHCTKPRQNHYQGI
jgi:hypothetical protein